MVVVDSDGVVKLFEVSPAALVCNKVPAVSAEYHLNVTAAILEAESVTVPIPQMEPGVTVGAVGIVFTVATTAIRGELSQAPLLKTT